VADWFVANGHFSLIAVIRHNVPRKHWMSAPRRKLLYGRLRTQARVSVAN